MRSSDAETSDEDDSDDEADDHVDLESLKAARAAAQKKRAKLEKQFLATLNMAVSVLAFPEERDLVLKILRRGSRGKAGRPHHPRSPGHIARFRTWTDKYADLPGPPGIGARAATSRLASYLRELDSTASDRFENRLR